MFNYLYIFRSGDIVTLCQYFTQFLENAHSDEDRMKKIRELVKELMPGLGGAAFHGTILLGWVLQDTISDCLLIGEGLAYMTAFYEPIVDLSSIVDGKGTKSLEEIILSVEQEQFADAFNASNWREFPVYQQRYARLQENSTEQLKDLISQWRIVNVDDALKELAICAAKAFVAGGSDDFFLLHGVTSCFGVFGISKCFPRTEEYFEDIKLFLLYYGMTLLSACIIEGMGKNIKDFVPTQNDFSSWEHLNQLVSTENCPFNDEV